MLNKKSYFIGSLLFFGMLLLVNLFDIRKYYTNESADFDSAIAGPLLYWGYSFLASSLVLLFINDIFFKKWFQNIFVWFVPLGLLATFTSDVYGGITQSSRGHTAGMFAAGLVALTIFFVAWNYFQDWRKKK